MLVQGVEAVKSELLDDIITESQPYQSPGTLLKRSDPARLDDKDVPELIKANE